ncbi:YifB family Mg chelatase-like AAA ATPase [Thiomicrospira microaerophila]|uniref:YifB family Mg chelatase-like AAA ATPase n=1 Tax=Thiomicrospira microaerophila TaxID=406020 RepID=UPI0024B10AE0|nr:YifB family Mg chelatase-like AAA ATPase [Thiomicrospira microaerophila]UQB42039.1 YifB family Mg chelatase-like AAA ATPase [Thiomicrospira microaerophila]
MSFALVQSRALVGMDAPLVQVEVHASNGLPSLSIVGLPEAAVKESKDRVRSALLNSGFELPPKRITINLAPADLPKAGSRFDLAIALAVLVATQQLPAQALAGHEFYGELGLNGELRNISGLLPALIKAKKEKTVAIIPQAGLVEASLLTHADIWGAKHLLEVCAYLTQQAKLQAVPDRDIGQLNYPVDLADVRGQAQAKRALEVAASGQHSLLMVGPPGAGKSMLAQRLVTLLPPMNEQEAIESAALRSIAGEPLIAGQFYQRFLKEPHHSSSAAALIGGGQNPKPGALTLAHHNVLFMDEFPEFKRDVIEALREPLETKKVNISRVKQQVIYPCDTLFVAAFNPTPSGFFSDDPRCTDSPDQIARYRRKISGPILDRIDLHLQVPAVEVDQLTAPCDPNAESSDLVRERVQAVREIQYSRQGCLNSALSLAQLEQYVELTQSDQLFLKQAMTRLELSARSYHKILRLARTLADMGRESTITKAHLAEALGYRNLERQGFK